MAQWQHPLNHEFSINDDERLRDKAFYGSKLGYPMPMRANMIENKYLLAWLGKYCPPSEWWIEITGGEPGMYPEISTLIPELHERGYKGCIRTNGTMPIPRFNSFPLIVGWHTTINHPPLGSDLVLIMSTDEEKLEYCEKNNIAFLKIHANVGQKYSRHIQYVEHYTFLNSVGQLTPCQDVKPPKEEINIFNLSPPPQKRYISAGCPFCINVTGFEYVLDNLPNKKEYLATAK